MRAQRTVYNGVRIDVRMHDSSPFYTVEASNSYREAEDRNHMVVCGADSLHDLERLARYYQAASIGINQAVERWRRGV